MKVKLEKLVSRALNGKLEGKSYVSVTNDQEVTVYRKMPSFDFFNLLVDLGGALGNSIYSWEL